MLVRPSSDFHLQFLMPAAELELDAAQLPPRANGAGTPAARQHTPASEAADDPESTAPLIDVGAIVRESPPWLVSAVVHMAVLIGLALWLIASDSEEPLLLNVRYAEEFGELDVESLVDLTDEPLDPSEVTPVDLPIVEDPLTLPEITPLVPMAPSLMSESPLTSIGASLSARTPGMREVYHEAFGGTKLTEDAVIAGLQWLARNQQSNGSWSLKGPYRDGANRENLEAATAMALLAFQGHGHTHQPLADDPFTRNVQRGWNWLLKQLHDDGRFFKDEVGDARLYTQAQCTIAICELYGMTHDEELRKPAQRAVDYCVKIQTPQGGWRYNPGDGNDLSVTGWFAMALQSARMAGLEVPSDTFKRLDRYLDSVQHDYGSRYSYQTRSGATPAMTAEGLLCRQYLGWERDDERLVEGVSYLLRYLPEWDERNVYHWYYATQVCHHMEGEAWQEWNAVMRQLLPEKQEQRGRERGSWDPNGDRWGAHGGRLYTTCLSIYMLEVYYRHLPIYRSAF